MKDLKLIDRVVVEVKAEQGSELSPRAIANQLRMIADEIEDDCMKGNNYTDEDLTQGTPERGLEIEVLWERECPQYGGFKMGNRSLISDAYYGAKQTFEVCCLEREDLENRDFDTSKLTNDDMERIAYVAGDLILDGCDYWTAVVEAARYWNVPTKRGTIHSHLDDVLVDDETETGGVSHHGETLREFLEESPSIFQRMHIDVTDDVSVLDDILKECGILPIE